MIADGCLLVHLSPSFWLRRHRGCHRAAYTGKVGTRLAIQQDVSRRELRGLRRDGIRPLHPVRNGLCGYGLHANHELLEMAEEMPASRCL